MLVTVVLGAINYRLDGNFWFYASSLQAFRTFSSRPGQWRVHGLTWIWRANWLGIPAATAVACIVYLIRGVARKAISWGNYQTFFPLQYLLAAAVMVVWYVREGPGLELSFYVSYLLPSMFLAIGACILAAPADEWTSAEWWTVAGSTAIAFAVSIRLFEGPLTFKLARIGDYRMRGCGVRFQNFVSRKVADIGLWIGRSRHISVGFRGVR